MPKMIRVPGVSLALVGTLALFAPTTTGPGRLGSRGVKVVEEGLSSFDPHTQNIAQDSRGGLDPNGMTVAEESRGGLDPNGGRVSRDRHGDLDRSELC